MLPPIAPDVDGIDTRGPAGLDGVDPPVEPEEPAPPGLLEPPGGDGGVDCSF
jgi:hypothetical protein